MDLPLWKKTNAAFFINRCSNSFERLFFYAERQQTLYLDLCLINTKYEKTSTFLSKSWTNPFGKMPILRLLYKCMLCRDYIPTFYFKFGIKKYPNYTTNK